MLPFHVSAHSLPRKYWVAVHVVQFVVAPVLLGGIGGTLAGRADRQRQQQFQQQRHQTATSSSASTTSIEWKEQKTSPSAEVPSSLPSDSSMDVHAELNWNWLAHLESALDALSNPVSGPPKAPVASPLPPQGPSSSASSLSSLESRDVTQEMLAIKEKWSHGSHLPQAVVVSLTRLQLTPILKKAIHLNDDQSMLDSEFWSSTLLPNPHHPTPFTLIVFESLLSLSTPSLSSLRPLIHLLLERKDVDTLSRIISSLISYLGSVPLEEDTIKSICKLLRQRHDVNTLLRLAEMDMQNGTAYSFPSLAAAQLSINDIHDAIQTFRLIPNPEAYPKLLMKFLTIMTKRGRMDEAKQLYESVYPAGCADPKFATTLMKGWRQFQCPNYADSVALLHLKQNGHIDIPFLTQWVQVKIQLGNFTGIQAMVDLIRRKHVVVDSRFLSILTKYLVESGQSIHSIVSLLRSFPQPSSSFLHKINFSLESSSSSPSSSSSSPPSPSSSTQIDGDIIKALLRDNRQKDAIYAVQQGIGGVRGLSLLLYHMIESGESAIAEQLLSKASPTTFDEDCFVSLIKMWIESGRLDDVDRILSDMESRHMDLTKGTLAILNDGVKWMQAHHLPSRDILNFALSRVEKMESRTPILLLDDHAVSLVMRLFSQAGHPSDGVSFYDHWAGLGTPCTLPLLEFLTETCIEAEVPLRSILKRLERVIGNNVCTYSERLLWLLEHEAQKEWAYEGEPLDTRFEFELKRRCLWHKQQTAPLTRFVQSKVIGEIGPVIREDGVRKWNWTRPSLIEEGVGKLRLGKEKKPSQKMFGELGPEIADGIRLWQWR